MARSTSKDQDSPPEGTALAESTTTADQSGVEQQAGPPSGTTAPSALTTGDVPGPSDVTIPKGGLEAMRERLGADLNEYGAELARRVLGELHIHRTGGVPASPIALEGADQLESEDADWWNERGKELAEKDFVGLNQRGSFSAALPPPPTPPAQERHMQQQTQPPNGAVRSGSAARSPQAPPLPPPQAPADQQEGQGAP